MPNANTIKVEICWIDARSACAWSCLLCLASGASAQQAINASGIVSSPHWPARGVFPVWRLRQQCWPQDPVFDGDRLQIVPELTANARALFIQRRAAKAKR